MAIFPRPLKQVLGRIIPFSKTDKIPIENLGNGENNYFSFINGLNNWTNIFDALYNIDGGERMSEEIVYDMGIRDGASFYVDLQTRY